MQLAMNASQAPRRTSNLARCDFSKQNSSISLGAVKAGLTLIRTSQEPANNIGHSLRAFIASDINPCTFAAKGALTEIAKPSRPVGNQKNNGRF
jgi:hypothetical protein